MVKSSKLPAGITRCRGRRHIETQSNHVFFSVLHLQPEHIRRSMTTVQLLRYTCNPSCKRKLCVSLNYKILQLQIYSRISSVGVAPRHFPDF